MSAVLDHQKLKKEIKAKAFKQEPLAEQLNISDRHLRNLCARDIDVSSSLLYSLSKALQLPMEELLTMRENKEEQT